jgi:hydrogenase maturation protease
VNEWEWQLLEEKTRVDSLTVGGSEVRVGDRVRLLPRKGGDILDLALAGQVAVIESIEQDYEGKNHVCVVLDDDPGKDLGLLRQPGHRFFFDAEEIEPLADEEARTQAETQQPRILVAGIGNIFLGDDGFGVEVAKRLLTSELPAGVRVVDFGIRGFDLAYALQDGYETVILVDAYPHGQTPGTVSLIEPDLSKLDANKLDTSNLDQPAQAMVETHGMDPLNVLRMAATMNGGLKANILLVGCEPATFGGEEGFIGLSDVVQSTVNEAAKMVISVVNRFLQEQRQGIY